MSEQPKPIQPQELTDNLEALILYCKGDKARAYAIAMGIASLAGRLAGLPNEAIRADFDRVLEG